MFITTSYRLRRLLRWVKRLIFKTKNTLPESPRQEITTSSTTEDVVMKSLDVKAKQEQSQWFQKKNDLRDVKFDLNPIWDNGHTLYGEGTGEYDEWKPSEIRTVEGYREPIYKDEVTSGINPWEDKEKFPIKNYPLTSKEASQLQSQESIDIEKTLKKIFKSQQEKESYPNTHLNSDHNHNYDTDHHNTKAG